MTQSVRDLAFHTIQDILNDNAYSNLKINEVINNIEQQAFVFSQIIEYLLMQ
jgi:hypothetical protein